jgi:hypothetical protein
VLERPQQLLWHAVVRRPSEGEPFDAVGVSVLRRGEAALGETQLAQQVVERLLGDAAVAIVAGDDPGVEIRRGEQRVVVEHLLEVRDEPLPIHGVPVEPAADEVVHAAGSHRVERRRHHRQRALVASQVHPQQELEHRGLRELRSVAPAAPLDVELGSEPSRGFPQKRLGQRLVRRRQFARAPNCIDDRSCLAGDVAAPLAVGVGDRDEHLLEARHSVARLGWVVRAAEERLARRREEDRHRPAALTRQRDDCIHVERVDVGPLLAVDLDVHEALVHQPGGLVIFEGLVCHDVAPVAR